jgi:hypothetical protein
VCLLHVPVVCCAALGPDAVQAILQHYPTPLHLHRAYKVLLCRPCLWSPAAAAAVAAAAAAAAAAALWVVRLCAVLPRLGLD